MMATTEEEREAGREEEGEDETARRGAEVQDGTGATEGALYFSGTLQTDDTVSMKRETQLLDSQACCPPQLPALAMTMNHGEAGAQIVRAGPVGFGECELPYSYRVPGLNSPQAVVGTSSASFLPFRYE